MASSLPFLPRWVKGIVRAIPLLLVLLAAPPARPERSGAPPTTIVIPSGPLRLKALLWAPSGEGPFPLVLFNHGSGSFDPQHTGELEITDAASRLAPVFAGRGYAFLYLFRRGQGLSADQGPFIQSLLRREAAARGAEARQELHYALLTTDHLDDVRAALSFVRTLAGIDARRIVLAGHSFGGQLALLAAERDDGVRAAVVFAAAADSWKGSPRMRSRMLTAAGNVAAPVMLVYAANDYSVAPGRALATELERAGTPHSLLVLPGVGRTADEGHMAVYTAVPAWEQQVFDFLDRHVRKEGAGRAWAGQAGSAQRRREAGCLRRRIEGGPVR